MGLCNHQQLLSPSAAADAGSLCLFLARSLAAAAATAGFEGLCVICCPLTVWGHASRSGRGSDVLLLLQQQQRQQQLRGTSSSRAATGGLLGWARRHTTNRRPSTASSGDGASAEWAVVHLGAEGLYEPEDVVSGLGDAFRCLARGFTSAQAVVCRMYTPNRVGPETLQLAARVLPALVLRPLLGFSEGCTRALQGARNQLRPSAREERLAVVRHPRTDVGLIPSDEDDDMLIA
ncbi:hypothetical protein Emed_001100 [Eimeria media]